MPVYEYSCPSCGVFEIIQKVSDAVLRRCPNCGRGVSKLISVSSFQFKGTGWYVTDYGRKGNGKKEKSAPEAEESKESKKASKGSEGKDSESPTPASGSAKKSGDAS